MEIKNFTDQNIRLGEFPVCVDVSNIPGYHSSDGVKVNLFAYKLEEEQHFFQIRKNAEVKNSYTLFYFKWEHQLENIPDHLSEVIFDSRDFENKKEL